MRWNKLEKKKSDYLDKKNRDYINKMTWLFTGVDWPGVLLDSDAHHDEKENERYSQFENEHKLKRDEKKSRAKEENL